MKVVWTAIIILVILCIFIGIHSYIINNMAEKILTECDKISEEMKAEEWSVILSALSKIEKEWDKNSLWAAMTISTEDIEQLEISLQQSRAFAETKQMSGFVGEFIMFRELIRHISAHEGIHLEEIL